MPLLEGTISVRLCFKITKDAAAFLDLRQVERRDSERRLQAGRTVLLAQEDGHDTGNSGTDSRIDIIA